MTIKGSLYLSILVLKRFLVAKKCPVKIPKGTSLPGTTSFDVFCVNIRPGCRL